MMEQDEPYSGEERRRGWQIDRHIPIALIITVVFQTGGLVWYARGLDVTVELHSTKIAEYNARLQQLEVARGKDALTDHRLNTIENEVRAVRNLLEEERRGKANR